MRICVMETLVVKTIEHLEGDYGLYTWPCAPVLAYLVHTHREWMKGKKVLELGAGTAVPGIAAAKLGAQVTLTDRVGNPRLLEALWHTCDLNKVPQSHVEIVALSWGVFSPQLLSLPPQDVVLASDCFYNSADFEDILVTVSYLMEKNQSCKFWTSYQERSSNRSLSPLLQRWGLQCERVPLDSVQESSSWLRIEGPSASTLDSSHTIHLWEITRQYQPGSIMQCAVP